MKNKKWIALGLFALSLFCFLFGDLPFDEETTDLITIKRSNDNAVIQVSDIVDLRRNENELQANKDTKIESSVSFSKNNPMWFQSGKCEYGMDMDTIYVRGIGMRETFDVENQIVLIDGIKNYVTIHGHPANVIIEGIANKVEIESSNMISTFGICNRTYYQNQLNKDQIKSKGILNIIRNKK